MIDALAFMITIASLATAVTVGVQAGVGRFRRARVRPALRLVEVALVVQAILDVVGLARGHRPGELATHLAYLVVSLVVVPLALAETQGHDDGRWSGAVLVLALVVLAVLVIRLQTTWRGAHA